MLSLLSLIIASGTVLRADTEQWEPLTYPDPRTNATECNVPHEGTLCDPDHILTETWRQTILDNVAQHMANLSNAKIPYNDEASPECFANSTEPVQIFVILAKRIHTASNQSITSNDLTQFGHGLREAFGLDSMPCKNYILVLGVELAKQIYLWTGSDLAIPKDQLDNSLAQYKNLFTERNYMEGLNKIVDEISSLLTDPFKDRSTTETTDIVESSTEEMTTVPSKAENTIPGWMYVVITICVSSTVLMIFTFILFFFNRYRNRQKVSNIYPPTGSNSLKSAAIVMQSNDDSYDNKKDDFMKNHQEDEEEDGGHGERKSSIDSETSHHPRSEHSDCNADNSSIASIDNVVPIDELEQDPINYENQPNISLDDTKLSTDEIIIRRNSELVKMSNTIAPDQYSSL